MRKTLNPGNYIPVFEYDVDYNLEDCKCSTTETVFVPANTLPDVQFPVDLVFGVDYNDVLVSVQNTEPGASGVIVGTHSGLGDVPVLVFCGPDGSAIQINETVSTNTGFTFSQWYYIFFLTLNGEIVAAYQSHVVDSICKTECELIKLSWSNSCDTETAYYSGTNFIQSAYFDVDFGRPTVDIFTEAKANGFGGVTNLRTTSRQRHNFDICVSNFQLYSIFAISQHSNITMELMESGTICELENMQIIDEGGADDCVAVVKLSYNIKGESFTTKNCCNTAPLTAC